MMQVFHKQQKPIQAESEPDAGSGLSSHRFHKSVIAASAANSTLRPECRSYEFNYGFIVIIQSAKNIVVRFIRNIRNIEIISLLPHVCLAIIANINDYSRCLCYYFFTA